MRKYSNRGCLCSFLLVLCTMLCENGYSTDPQLLYDSLQVSDQEFLSGYHVVLNATEPSDFDRSSARILTSIDLVGNADRKGYKSSLIEERGILYKQGLGFEEGVGYDKDNTLWRISIVNRILFCDGHSWKLKNVATPTGITSDNTTVLRPENTEQVIDVYPIDDSIPNGAFYRFLFSMGRGYTGFLDRITDIVADSEGLVSCKATGRSFSGRLGTWHLNIDTTHAFLIQSASFQVADQKQPLITVHSSHLMQGNTLPIYGKGKYRVGGSFTDMEVTSFDQNVDSALLGSIADNVSSLSDYPVGTILDYTKLDPKGEPFMYKKRGNVEP